LKYLAAFKDFVSKNKGTKLLELKNSKIGMIMNRAKVLMEVKNFINVDTITIASITNGLSTPR